VARGRRGGARVRRRAAAADRGTRARARGGVVTATAGRDGHRARHGATTGRRGGDGTAGRGGTRVVAAAADWRAGARTRTRVVAVTTAALDGGAGAGIVIVTSALDRRARTGVIPTALARVIPATVPTPPALLLLLAAVLLAAAELLLLLPLLPATRLLLLALERSLNAGLFTLLLLGEALCALLLGFALEGLALDVVGRNLQRAAETRHLLLLGGSDRVRVCRPASGNHDVGVLELLAERRDGVFDFVVIGTVR